MKAIMWRTSLVLCLAVTIWGDEGDWRVVKTRQGPVRGRKDPAGLHIFANIPYATVPKGTHKFSDPLPPPAWLQPLEVPEKGIICPQDTAGFIDTQTVTMQEECLIANVYVPITEEKNLPVLVYVHGGAFQIGFGNMMTPKNFVKENKVIVVTFNYRLGVHGFLCLGTDAAPGNAGLKDQVALLQWVKKNIASFGGNPENVAIAGYSAGSVSVDLLMLAKSAKGLFNKVILESGASVGSIAVQSNPLENAKLYAQKLNFTNVDDIYALEDFYKSSSLESLIGNTFVERKDASLLFGPCVERKSKSAFLYESPVDILKKGEYKKVPILLGISDMEGLLHISKFETWKNEMNDNFADFLPPNLQFDDDNQKKEVAKAIKQFYFGHLPVNEDTVLSYINYISDVYFAYPTLKTVSMHAENGHEQVYLYEYSFVDDQTVVVPHTDVRGAGHCAQTVAIFDGAGLMDGIDESELSEEFKNIKAKIRQLWNNFVVYGKPVPEESSLPSWPSARVDRSPHMFLGETIELRESLLESRARFWDDIHQKHYRAPMPPPMPPHTEL